MKYSRRLVYIFFKCLLGLVFIYVCSNYSQLATQSIDDKEEENEVQQKVGLNFLHMSIGFSIHLCVLQLQPVGNPVYR